MAKASPLQSSFNGGEVSPLFQGRVDMDRYRESMATCQNYVPTIQGGLTRRPGTYYVAEVKNSAHTTRLVAFQYSTSQNYVLEFGDNYMRVYQDNGQVQDGASPFECSTIYDHTEIMDLQFAHIGDLMYITHPDHLPQFLQRFDDDDWELFDVEFLDGPYLAIDTTGTTISNNTTGGTATLTASSTAGINGGAGFQSTDVGRLIRIKDGSTWVTMEIDGYTSTTVVTAARPTTAMPAFSTTGAKTTWRLGLYSDTTGWPAATAVYEDRLIFAGCAEAFQRVDMTKTGGYAVDVSFVNFAPSDSDGTITSSHGVAFTLNSGDNNPISWIVPQEKGLLIGTNGSEWVVKSSSNDEALSPTNINAKRVSSYGSASVPAFQVGRSAIFVQKGQRKLREMSYFYDVDGFRCADLSVLAEHITSSGIVDMAVQRDPQTIVWCVLEDGTLVGMTYDRDSESLRAGWHKHVMGGVVDTLGSQAEVESIAVIPSSDGLAEELWLVVKRRIDGAAVKTIEYMTQLFGEDWDQQDAFFVDCGLTLDNPKTITGVTKANPAVVTSTSHGFSNGDSIKIVDVQGMTELNDRNFTAAGVTANTFQLSGEDSSAYETYVSGGEARKRVTSLSGLDHLEGETVSILADGAVQTDRAVASGAITLTTPAAVVHVGLGYESDVKLLRFEAGASDGTALGKTRRTNRVGVLLHRSLGLKIGFSFEDLTEVVFRTTADAASAAPPLFSGLISESTNSSYDMDNQICLRQDQPLPSTILAVMPQLVTQDR